MPRLTAKGLSGSNAASVSSAPNNDAALLELLQSSLNRPQGDAEDYRQAFSLGIKQPSGKNPLLIAEAMARRAADLLVTFTAAE